MSKTDIATGEVIQTNRPVHFSSNTEDNHEGTDKKDLHDRMVDKMQESLATFQPVEKDPQRIAKELRQQAEEYKLSLIHI